MEAFLHPATINGGTYLAPLAVQVVAPATPIVTDITISPTSATVAGGATRQFAATVLGLNSPSQAVSWSASAGSVDANGLFTAPATTAPHQYITVTATSVADPSKSRSVSIVVPGSNPPTQSGLFITRRRSSRRVLRNS